MKNSGSWLWKKQETKLHCLRDFLQHGNARQSDSAISNTERYPITLEQKYSLYNFTLTVQLAELKSEK